jgi:hypothetical protein
MILAGGLLAGLLLIAGCQPLSYEKDYQLDTTAAIQILFDPPKYDQNVKVLVVSPGHPVSACLVKEEDKDRAEGALNRDTEPAGALASKLKGDNFTLEAKVPAKTAYVVVVFNPDRKELASVKVKVTGR